MRTSTSLYNERQRLRLNTNYHQLPVTATDDNNATTASQSLDFSQQSYNILLATLFVIFSFVAGLHTGYDFTKNFAHFVTTKDNNNNNDDNDDDTTQKKNPFLHPQTNALGSSDAHATSLSTLVGLFSIERDNILQNVRSDYGSYYTTIFDKSTSLDRIFRLSPLSRDRLVRRLSIKLLRRLATPTGEAASTPTVTWVTAGDSAAAGHGNLLSQSYTSVLSQTVSPVFAALGMEFVAKNYAMGHYDSDPELSFCLPSVYGGDIDVMTWDFSLGRVKDYDHRLNLWGNRVGVHPTRPFLMVMDNGDGEGGRRRYERFRALEEGGVGVGLMDRGGRWGELKGGVFPDALDEKAKVEKEGLMMNRPGVRTTSGASVTTGADEEVTDKLKYYVCDGSTEGAVRCDNSKRYFMCTLPENALCREHKYRTKTECQLARYQNSFNPGWKDHHLKGRLLGLFLIDILQDVFLSLDALRFPSSPSTKTTPNNNNNNPTPQSYHTILATLLQKETADRDAFLRSPVAFNSYVGVTPSIAKLNTKILFRQPSYCHTALLPSDHRYAIRAFDAGTAAGGRVVPSYSSSMEERMASSLSPRQRKGSYDVGWNRNDGDGGGSPLIDRGYVPLMYDPSERQICESLDNDYKDYFFVPSGVDHWLNMTVPPEETTADDAAATINDGSLSDADGNNDDNNDEGGYIILHFRKCTGDFCETSQDGYHLSKHLSNGDITILVDGEPVASAEEIIIGSYFLEGRRGLRWIHTGVMVENDGIMIDGGQRGSRRRRTRRHVLSFRVKAGVLPMEISSVVMF